MRQVNMNQMSKSNVGGRLRTLREQQGWSLRALAERCGLSINAISRIERGENSPTVSSLQRLADAMLVPITDFFVEKSQRSVIYTPRGAGHRVSNVGYAIEQLGFGLPGQQLQSFLMFIEPNQERAAQLIRHPGEEFIYCLEGTFHYTVGEDSFDLLPGDSLLFEASQPHSWWNISAKPAQALLIFQAAPDNTLARQGHILG